MINRNMDIKKWIMVECAKEGISQAELSRRIGFSSPPNFNHSIATDRIRVKHLEEIADALGKDLIIQLRDKEDTQDYDKLYGLE